VILLDTNVLVHATGARSLQHASAKELRDQAAGGQFDACIAAQILTEFYAVVTDPRRFQPALAPSQAPKETTVTRMLNLLGSRSVKAGRIFDIFLAATMLDNGVQRIYTENVSDFQGIAGIDAINPFPH
jgi:predicted nucleic acid-binding protein